MDWRNLRLDDLDRALQIHPELFGDKVVPAPHVPRLWAKLLRAPGFYGVAIVKGNERNAPMCGFGASVFVPKAFADGEMARPRPGINGRVTERLLVEEPTVFSSAAIARANAANELTICVLAGRWSPHLTDETEIQETRRHLAASFASLHSGYRISRVMIELINEHDRRFASEVPIMRIHREIGDLRALAVVEKVDVETKQGSVLAPHFASPCPKLFFKTPQQNLLLAALDGATDAQLAEKLKLSKRVVKSRWVSIFEQISATMPELLPNKGSEHAKRGYQKRHFVLAYLRKHPEELRPFSRSQVT